MISETNLSVILPTLDEKENIQYLIPDIMSLNLPKIEILVIDDGSIDGTREMVLELKDTYKDLVLIARDSEKGYASAIKKGIKEAKGNYIVWLDCDYSHPPELISIMLDCIERNDLDIVVASRFLPTSRDLTSQGSHVVYFQKILSRCLSRLCGILFYKKITDYTSGYICIRKKKIPETVGVYGDFFMELVVRCIDANLKYFEIPYVSPPRKYGRSKTGTTYWEIIVTGRLYLKAIIRLLFRTK